MAKAPAWKKSRMSFEKLAKKIQEDTQKGKKAGDERFYYPERDENDNGSAVIRFLPPCEGEELPWVKVYSHGFRGDGGMWFIEECPTTINKECPVCEENSKLWYSGIESDKEIVRKRKRRLQYITNILVVQDKKNPENEGKVFLFKFGAKIFDKIKDAMYPEFEEDGPPINPFDFIEGANFNLRIRRFEGNINYDKSHFDVVSPIAESEKEITEIWKQQHPLKEFVEEKRFKTYNELSERLAKVLRTKSSVASTAEADSEGSEDLPWEAEKPARTAKPKEEKILQTTDEDDESEALDYFRKLAEED